jgi:hypothetical protein
MFAALLYSYSMGDCRDHYVGLNSPEKKITIYIYEDIYYKTNIIIGSHYYGGQKVPRATVGNLETQGSQEYTSRLTVSKLRTMKAKISVRVQRQRKTDVPAQSQGRGDPSYSVIFF